MFRSIEFFVKTGLCALLAVLLCQGVLAQAPTKSKATAVKANTSPGPKVTQIDTDVLQSLLKPKGKPLLINFWATWCDPCREEFPDLVKLDTLYRGKIDMVTISLDDLADINGDVPKFLTEMKAEMPAYLLHTTDDDAAIKIVSKDWAGNLPLTIFFDKAGNVAYQKNGKVRFDTVKENIDRVLGTPSPANGSSPSK